MLAVICFYFVLFIVLCLFYICYNFTAVVAKSRVLDLTHRRTTYVESKAFIYHSEY
jgi:hypothetical protein